jgi:hypothetical protein
MWRREEEADHCSLLGRSGKRRFYRAISNMSIPVKKL